MQTSSHTFYTMYTMLNANFFFYGEVLRLGFCLLYFCVRNICFHELALFFVKNAAFQSSSLHHAAQLTQTFQTCGVNTVRKPVLLLYTDGGSDHCCNFVSVQVSPICLFKRLQQNYLVAARTAPMQWYRNLVERCIEKVFSSGNSPTFVRALAPFRPQFKDGNSQPIATPLPAFLSVKKEGSTSTPLVLCSSFVLRKSLRSKER